MGDRSTRRSRKVGRLAATVATVTVATVTAATAGCFSPSLPAVSCDQTRLCPTGQICALDGTCQDAVTDGGAGQADGSPLGHDARPPDASALGFCGSPAVTLCLEFENTITDGSARANAVTSDSLFPVYDTGVTGEAIRFDGTYGLSVPSYRDDVDAETIEFWMTPPNGDNEQDVLQTGNLRVFVADGTLAIDNGGSTVSIGLGGPGFTHIAVRTQGTSLAVFGNGTPQINVPLGVMPGTDLTIAGRPPNARYTGTIDQLRIWTRALSDAEVQAAMSESQ